MCREHEHHEHVEVVAVSKPILEDNEKAAAEIRRILDARGIRAFEFLGSPGSGKTALIERLIELHSKAEELAYIGGDVATTLDTERIRKRGVRGVQINTGGACHLEAFQVLEALRRLDLEGVRYLFIENVGNLICPIFFEVGAHKRVLVVSVTEGEDKFIKHPMTVKKVDVIVINKIDLADAVGVHVEHMIEDARRLNPRAKIVTTSAKTGAGIGELAQALGIGPT